MDIRQATFSDLDEIMKVEQTWPESARAPREKFIARLENFPEGFFIATSNNRIVATITACLTSYDPDHPEKLSSWETVTNNGYFDKRQTTRENNSLYIASGVVEKAYSGTEDVFSACVLKEYELSKELGLDFILAGSVLPRYSHYLKTHSDTSAAQYVMTKKSGKPIDPLLCKYQQIGFDVPDERHVIENYFPDADSKDYAAIVVREVK